MFVRCGHTVREVAEGSSGLTREGRLTVDLNALAREVEQDDRIALARLTWVRPGDRTRVVSVVDVFDARWKEGGLPTFPGIDGPPVTAGQGRTHVLEGLQIVATALLPVGEGGLMVAHPMMIDFWGEGAQWTTFSNSFTLVADIELNPELQDKGTADDAIRRALVTLSTSVGQLAAEDDGDEIAIPAAHERERVNLPRASYVYQIQSQGPPLQTFLYGADLDGLYPTLIDPVELLDGALVSGNRGLQPTPTIWHCNNPVIRRLIQEDGQRLTLLPTVLMEGHHKTTALKHRSARHAVELLRYVGADMAVFTQEGGGMSVVDQMMTLEGAAQAGIHSVAITYEMAGSEGSDTPLIYFSPAAKHLVSTGNREERLHLDAPSTVLGPGAGTTRLGDLTSAVEVPLSTLYGAISQVGATRAQAHVA